jgi:hypothetical protein
VEDGSRVLPVLRFDVARSDYAELLVGFVELAFRDSDGVSNDLTRDDHVVLLFLLSPYRLFYFGCHFDLRRCKSRVLSAICDVGYSKLERESLGGDDAQTELAG